MTLLEIVNTVLRRLREDEVTALSDTAYARVIGDFVSDVHQEVMEAHDWGVRYKIVEWDTVASQREYDLSATVATTGDVISGGTVTTLFSEPVWLPQSGLNGWLYLTSTSTEPNNQLTLLRDVYAEQYYQEDRDYEDRPGAVSFYQNPTTGGLTATMTPVPDDAYRIRCEFFIPEDELLTDGTDDSTTVDIPSRPIVLGALYYALNERGEEMGEPGGIAEMRYRNALGAAIEADSRARKITERYEWVPD